MVYSEDGVWILYFTETSDLTSELRTSRRQVANGIHRFTSVRQSKHEPPGY